MKKVLVLTYGEDPHADAVGKYLQERKVDIFRLDTENLIESYSLTFDGESGVYSVEGGNRKISLGRDWSIWNRRLLNPDLVKGTPRNLEDLIFEETSRTWDGLLISHTGKVVNRPHNQFYANNKINQLVLAKSIGKGIGVPDTIVTNDPGELKDFYEKQKGNISFKLQKGIVLEREGEYLTVYNNKVKKEDLKNANLVRSHPCMFQEYIEKDFEARIIATDQDQIGVAIHSQNSEISKIDFRRYDFDNVPYTTLDLPTDVMKFCDKMIKHYGLHFGVFDFIVSPNGKYTFLELNPNGQWLWLEEKSGTDLVGPIAENLIN